MVSERQLSQSFEKAIRSIRDNVAYGALRDAIARGDYDGALRSVDVDDAAFDPLRGLILQAYAEGGVNATTGVKWPVAVRWNSATPQAESFARYKVGGDITKITDDTRAAVRWIIGDGIAFGRSPNRIALDIAGRVQSNGSRSGGIVGLNEQQTKWVADMRVKLGGVPDWPSIKANTRRDHRFDAMIERAYRNGATLTSAQIDRISGRYSDRLLYSRGLAIARTERGAAINMGTIEGYRQAAAKVGIPEDALIKEWRHNGMHKNERVTHVAADKTRVVGLNTPFDIGGFECQFPHDQSLPASEVINCDCTVRVIVPRSWR